MVGHLLREGAVSILWRTFCFQWLMSDIPITQVGMCVCVCVCVCACVCVFSHVQLFVTPWIIACQAHLSMGFSRQEYWSGLPFLFLGIFPTQGLNPGLLHCRNHQMQLYRSNILYPATDVLFDVNEGAGKNSSLNPIAQVLGAPPKNEDQCGNESIRREQ